MPICHEPCENRIIRSQGVAKHRKAHLDRGEECVITLATGTWRYKPKSTDEGAE